LFGIGNAVGGYYAVMLNPYVWKLRELENLSHLTFVICIFVSDENAQNNNFPSFDFP